MPKFLVTYEVHEFRYIEVEAKDLDEAERMWEERRCDGELFSIEDEDGGTTLYV